MKIKLTPRINTANGQINFQLKKTSLPDSIKKKIGELKEIKIDTLDFKFNEFEGRFNNEHKGFN
jgi:hypothetical protein